ncbi:MAG: scramblase [Hymenobacteraceae bacterium]|nr:scramblase [Hymenobacteraceae bacterium]
MSFLATYYHPFFDHNDYFVDEKVNYFKFANEYKIFDATGEQVGAVAQRVSGWHKVLRSLLNIKKMMPFTLSLTAPTGETLLEIKRGWTFWMAKIVITDPTGAAIGHIHRKWTLLKPSFHILDAEHGKIAEISGDWKAWNFRITDAQGAPIGTISKKWNGMMKEAFTSADKYIVSVDAALRENTQKVAILAAAITIDMVLKESK